MNTGNWIGGVIGGFARLSRRLASETRGNVAMLFGLTMPVLILMAVGGVDIHRASTVRVNLQDALDAAALAAARSPYTKAADIQRVGEASLKANLAAYPNIKLSTSKPPTFVLTPNDIVIANAKVDVKAIVANIFLPPYGKFMDDYIVVGSHSEVNRASRNVEVALVLDITGSMDTGTRLEDMQKAAKDLVDKVIQTNQTPYYSKVALVPYSFVINPGSYLTATRGNPATYVNVTGAVMNVVGAQKTITAATRARPVVITSNNHGFANNEVVWISGATGMTQINNKAYIVKNRTTNTFELYKLDGTRVDGTGYSSYSGSAGKVQRCQDNDCSVIVTAAGHTLTNNDYVYFTNVSGLNDSSGTSVVNGKPFLVGNVTSTTFTIEPPESSTITPYASGGRAWCAQVGCEYLAFENMEGDLVAHRISGCITERTGADAYTEKTPAGGRWLGRHYPNTSGGACGLGPTIMPLSSDAATIKTRIGNFVSSGSTAGQIGIGWGWYMLSPEFNSIWPSGSAGDYNPAKLLKAVVIMTDGEFNTPYCSGVIPDNWGAGTSAAQRIDCTEDGVSRYEDPFAQSRKMCEAMKLKGVIIYTVGLQIDANGDAADLLEDCASSRDNFFMPASGADLSDAFAAIGRDIVQLRISK
ncbi:Flp pilus assembly protein TadG [Brevundimonas lenta]|uniref:Flp pilus assembly protein TadG n=2 Tax=Brevundimonas lenta TaxID=424796 RepID=A0A7W6JB69_9CAUL|nr:TadE/TadG family type IV pilus assembly protein [Brevundimonas lenta]MBB4081884.1 Flp pilus assembly protein TadG [Brevundimonas lenta]